MSSKPLVIYHDNCTDGFAAAFAAWLKLGDEAEYLPMQYGNTGIGRLAEDFSLFRIVTPSDELVEIGSRDVYILDFSFEKPVMHFIFEHAKCVVWLDHHKTAFEMWCDDERNRCEQPNGQDYVLLDNNKSGALLAWEYFHPGVEVPMLIQHIDDRDRWQFKLEGSKELHAALQSYKPWSFEQWEDTLDLRDDTAIEQMVDEGWAILRAHDQNVQSVVEATARGCQIPLYSSAYTKASGEPLWQQVGTDNPHIGLASNCPYHLASDVGHEIATRSGTFGLVWCLGSEGTVVKCSLRSNGDYDVSAIAKVFGGGGHKNAAGFETDIDTLMGWLK